MEDALPLLGAAGSDDDDASWYEDVADDELDAPSVEL